MNAPKVGDRVAITGVRALAGHIGTVVPEPSAEVKALLDQWDIWVEIDHDDYRNESAPGLGFGPIGFRLHEVEPWTRPESAS